VRTRPIFLVTAALVVIACAVPLFYELGRDPLGVWDESRHALSALEQTQGGNPLVTRYEGRPDLWNTKPPLMVWLQTATMMVLGQDELAVRLPSAIAALLTALVLIAFAVFVLERPRVGLFAALLLALSEGYVVAPHVARSGDVDALFTLWTTIYSWRWRRSSPSPSAGTSCARRRARVRQRRLDLRFLLKFLIVEAPVP
jgi:4-amino-4-deoxy-L-arabinose transferase-like glycosyltransferase